MRIPISPCRSLFSFGVLIILFGGLPAIAGAQATRLVQAETKNGLVEGVVSADGLVHAFKGIPYAAPPIGNLRWQPPQPAAPWAGVRPTHNFPPRAMQVQVWDDMFFYDDGPSEDCLYLNVWTAAKPAPKPLPVMVWIHGGGFRAGSTSEPRQNGENLAKKGVVVVSMTYRMGVFGFYAHPELSAESPHGASGNYGLMDMVASLEWVRDNIAAFGGDPHNVTIFGESAGSFAVSLLMASPTAEGLFHKAIGESGAALGRVTPSREKAEAAGVAFAQSTYGSTALVDLRAVPAKALLVASEQAGRFGPNVDGWFLPDQPAAIYAAGRQSEVPLLAGWNLDEGGPGAIFGRSEPTLANYLAAVQVKFGDAADAFLAAYSASNDAEARRAASDFGGDSFIGYGTWKWIEAHARSGEAPVYRYLFDHPLPLALDAKVNDQPRAAHSWEIEYVFGVLDSKALPWRPEDYQVSELMMNYWTNFAKRSDPNGPGLREWPAYQSVGSPVMHLSPAPTVTSDDHRVRYEFMDRQPME